MPEALSALIGPGRDAVPSGTIGPSFDSGYESKFDFPRYVGPPRLRYMLATIPRTGSTYFSHLLWRTGCLGAPLEYLDYSPENHNGEVTHSPAGQIERWRDTIATRTSPNGVFGFKCFLMHLQALARANEALLESLFPSHVILLQRRDRTAQAVSYARAHLTGVWCKEQSLHDNERVGYSLEAARRAERWIEAQTRAWFDLFDELGIEPLRLWYEDILAAPDLAVTTVANFLGIELSPGTEIDIPPIEKQSHAEARHWREAYARDRLSVIGHDGDGG
ncbi:MAG: trehalose 2-sulfotransferase [Sphingomonadales bacterium]|jgi:LPS sulfotransferase NodH|nr:trehalose 2-sulfotransferase [Sphingomonadales bacterium]